METRANFILIGVFTLLAILGTLAFFIWLASFQIDRQYATYSILFEDVSGLDASGDVFFNGIPVGSVVTMEIYEKDPSKVITTVEIDAETPVRADTVAQLQSQGVTGVAYISLSGGTPEAPLLDGHENGWPVIQSRRSSVQSLVEDAPDLLIEAKRLLEQFQALTGPENQAHVTNILRNLDTSSTKLDQAFADFSEISGTLRDATDQITRFTGRLDSIAGSVETTLENADGALISAEKAFETADTALTSSLTAIDGATGVFSDTQEIINNQVPEILTQISEVLTQTNEAIDDLHTRSAQTIDGFGDTSELLNARLVELEQALVGANTAFDAVTEASESFDFLVDGEGTLLVAEARVVLADAKAAIATINTVVIDDVPAIVSDIRTAVASASDAVKAVAENLTNATDRFDPMATQAEQTMASASALFERSQISLVTLDQTLTAAEKTLGSAQGTFDAATKVMETDLAPVFEDVRIASDKISTAVTDLAEDMPAVVADLRALISRSDAVVAQVQSTVASSAPGIRDFAGTGLQEITRLATEARVLVTTLGNLSRRIDRNPARFFLDDRVPEYRR